MSHDCISRFVIALTIQLLYSSADVKYPEGQGSNIVAEMTVLCSNISRAKYELVVEITEHVSYVRLIQYFSNIH